jgi:prepilin-type N-terminal cleavage/methylation domain-containing protein
MLKMTASRVSQPKKRLNSFTLIELLVVMAIIAILASLILMAFHGVWIKAARSRASAEIQAMSAALESYKADNGIYPPGDGSMLLTNTPYTSLDGTSSAYQTNSQLLYQALSGQTNFTDTPVPGRKAYMTFKANQVGDPTGTVTKGTYVKDPWNYSYGYSTGTPSGAATTNYPYNGSGFFDLWSTGGVLGNAATNANAWVSNWQ